MNKRTIIVITVLVLAAALSVVLKPDFRQQFDKAYKVEYDKKWKEAFRPGFIKSCQNGELSEHRKNMCECAADQIVSQFTVDELKTWTTPEKVDTVRRDKIIQDCEEKFPDLLAGAPDFAKAARELNTPKQISAEKAAEQIVQPAEAEAEDKIYLKNGQVVSCHIVKKDENGISANINGLEVYFSNSEIKETK